MPTATLDISLRSSSDGQVAQSSAVQSQADSRSDAPGQPHLAPQSPVGHRAPERTIFGLDAVAIHARYWAGFGVQVVRIGEPSLIVPHAELYLLTEPRSLPMFRLSDVMDVLNWVAPHALFLRIHDDRERSYRERAITNNDDQFVRFQRVYSSADRLARVLITDNIDLAKMWQNSASPTVGWRRARRSIRRTERVTRSIDGEIYDRLQNEDIARLMNELINIWDRPDATITRLRVGGSNGTDVSNGTGVSTDAGTKSSDLKREVWLDPTAGIEPGARTIGNVWVGAGRMIAASQTIVGPAVLWDDPNHRPASDTIRWLEIEPTAPPPDDADPHPVHIGPATRIAKRAFDIVFALAALVLTLPLWPLIFLMIWWQDGKPFFFSHERESLGGRKFLCHKFRSMRRDAESLVAQLGDKNKSDAAHVIIENDPRVTPIGKILRKTNLDELPQFWNVLIGDMSVVGPRPSPERENQFCPAWREVRLSVRPGITGLWQISRTRKAGLDFQEWVKYDIEYVDKMSLWLDVKIIYITIAQIMRKIVSA